MMGFLEAMADRGLELYPAQEEAILELLGNSHVILNTPTGSGKSMVALALHFKALCEGKRVAYTSPIKALVSEKFFALCDDLGAENVGMMTGDASMNKDAPIVCCTAEILSNIALRDGERAPFDYVVMDEFHYYADKDRGIAWQVPLLTMPRTMFLLMSATLGDTLAIADGLEQFTGRPVKKVTTAERPVPLDFTYSEDPIHEAIEKLLGSNKAPIYVVNFTQRACAEQAQSLMSIDFVTKEHKGRIKEALAGFKFDTAYGKDIKRYLHHGLGLHHAGLLPKYRLVTEQLSQQGLLRVICGTDTLGVGVNIPIRTVLFAKLCKYDGEKTAILSVRDFKQIAGRAGRKGFDDAGSVVAQAPEHVIENLRLEAKARGLEGKKKKKIVKKKPPDRGYVHFDQATFERLQKAEPEPLESRFFVTHGMVLNLAQGHDDGYARLMRLIESCHDTDKQKEAHRARAETLIASLEEAELISLVPGDDGPQLRVRDDLQIDFSLNQTLSLYLVETLGLLDEQSETFALDVLTLVEAILENPRVILMKQVDRLKREKVAELKAAGVEYDQRMEELEKIEHPKPLREFVYESFNAFAKKHPWVGEENIRPKSICREMVERFMTFHDYIREYGLQRSEGILLRHISQTYRTLAQTVPETQRTEGVYDVLGFLRTMLAQTDTSLIEEWESLLHPSNDAEAGPEHNHDAPTIDYRRDPRAFKAALRAEVHHLVKALAEKDYEMALRAVQADEAWDEKSLEDAMAPFYEQHQRLVFDHRARLVDKTVLEDEGDGRYRLRQVLVDDAEDNDWFLAGDIDLTTWTPDQPLLRLRTLGS